jgi:pyruvate dehydrogenase E2 component (dihydrolipoamide acetyltransferase)
MANFEFKLPDIGEGVTEGEIVGWLVEVGDTVGEDQDVVEVMTDKATVTIGAPQAGKITELRGKEGDVVPVGQVLLVLETDGASEGGLTKAAPARTEPSGDTSGGPVGNIQDELPGMGKGAPPPAPRGDVETPTSAGDHFVEKPLAAPATR